MSAPAMSTPLNSEDKFIDLVKLAKGTQSNNTSKPQTNPRKEVATIKAPKTPLVRLVFPQGSTSSEEEADWEHELEFGFGSIWSEYECMHLQAKSSGSGDCRRGNGNVSTT
jgi:hypothetical protein